MSVDHTSISDFVRRGLVSCVVELGRRVPAVPSMAEQERLLRLVEMAEVEYSGSRDPRFLSALAVGRVAAEFFVWSGLDLEAGARLLDALRMDSALASA